MTYQRSTGPVLATGTITPRALSDRMADFVNIADFGAVGDGTTDDSAAFSAAFTYATANNIGTIYLNGATYLLLTPPELPARTRIVGQMLAVGTPLTISGKLPKTRLIIPSSQTLTINAMSCVENMIVERQGISYPFTSVNYATQLAAFAGTAITLKRAATDTVLRNVMILGFDLGVAATAGLNARVNWEHLLIDCNNGVHVKYHADPGWMRRIHVYPWCGNGVSGIPGAGRKRPGFGIKWGWACENVRNHDHFVFGYTYGYVAEGCSHIRMYGCDFDAGTTVDGVKSYGIVAVNAPKEVAYVSSIVSAGSGYTVGDTITLSGGLGYFWQSVTPAVLTVTSVSGGAVTGVSVTTPGFYNVLPSGTVSQASSSGAGTGATFRLKEKGAATTVDQYSNNTSYRVVNLKVDSCVIIGATSSLTCATGPSSGRFGVQVVGGTFVSGEDVHFDIQAGDFQAVGGNLSGAQGCTGVRVGAQSGEVNVSGFWFEYLYNSAVHHSTTYTGKPWDIDAAATTRVSGTGNRYSHGAKVFPGIQTADLVSTGSGYAVDDTIVINGGTFKTRAELTVTEVDGSGAIVSFDISDNGSYAVLPSNPASQASASVTSGTGATFNLTLGSFVFSNKVSDILECASYYGTDADGNKTRRFGPNASSGAFEVFPRSASGGSGAAMNWYLPGEILGATFALSSGNLNIGGDPTSNPDLNVNWGASNGATTAFKHTLRRINTSSPTTGDMGQIACTITNSVGTEKTLARLTATASAITDTAERGYWSIETANSGTLKEWLRVNYDGKLVHNANTVTLFDANSNLLGKITTVSGLTAAATAGAGARAFVTDGTVAASGNFGATVAGGGTNKVPVFSDGTNWLIG